MGTEEIDPAIDDKMIPVGRIVKTHGIKGEIKLIPYLQPLELYGDIATLFINDDKGNGTAYPVQKARPHKNCIICKFESCQSIEDAQLIVGREVETFSSELPTLLNDEYYWNDLEGLAVFNESDTYLGKIEAILSTGSNDVLLVRGEENGELLLPAIKKVILDVNLPEGKIIVRPLEWLE